MPTNEPSDEFLEKLRGVLLDVSSKQIDSLMAVMRNLSDAQTKALSRTLSQALAAQSDAVVAALNAYVIRIHNLERAVESLREAGTSEESGSGLQ
jgi:hypothetical protein